MRTNTLATTLTPKTLLVKITPHTLEPRVTCTQTKIEVNVRESSTVTRRVFEVGFSRQLTDIALLAIIAAAF